MKTVLWAAVLMLSAARELDGCGASDANLLFRRQRICASLTQSPSYYCGESWKNVSKDVAHEDWPSQATYMHDMLAALSGPTTCLNTSYVSAPFAAGCRATHGGGASRATRCSETDSSTHCSASGTAASSVDVMQ